MINKYLKILLLLVIFGSLFFVLNSANAVQCSTLGSQAPFWGNDSATTAGPVNAAPNSQVRVSIRGEDGCKDQTVVFQVLKEDGITEVAQIQGKLVLGPRASGGLYFLNRDWTNNLTVGKYKVKLFSLNGDVGIRSNVSSSILNIQALQACNFSKVYASPNGGKPGDRVQLTVEATGTCQNWGVTIDVCNALVGGRCDVFHGSEQKFSSGNNKLQWAWTLPALPAGAPQAPYKIKANLGSQTLESTVFLVTSAASTGGICNNNGTCDAGETSATCSDCPVAPGGTQNIPFSIPNPLQANNLVELIDIIATWLFNLSIPITVAMIVYAGVIFLISRGDTAKVTQAKNILLYAVVGFAIILIGKGFITLIESILNLGANP